VAQGQRETSERRRLRFSPVQAVITHPGRPASAASVPAGFDIGNQRRFKAPAAVKRTSAVASDLERGPRAGSPMRLHQVTPDRAGSSELIHGLPVLSHAHHGSSSTLRWCWTGRVRLPSSPNARDSELVPVIRTPPLPPLLSRRLAVGNRPCWVGSRSRGARGEIMRTPCDEQPGGGVQWRIASHCAPSV